MRLLCLALFLMANDTAKKLSIYYQNIRGLRTKTDDFYRQLCVNLYDVVILTETWLVNGISDSELFCDRYIVWRRDRDYHRTGQTRGGGVLIAVNKLISAVPQPLFQSTAEDLWVSGLEPNHNLTLNASAKWLIEASKGVQDPAVLLEKFSQNKKVDDTTRALLLTFYGILVVIGAVGNALVVISVVRKPVMRTARNMFIVNLAVSDALVCCVGTPLTLMELLTKHWPLPDWPSLCKACGAIQAISIFVSTISITAIALDRYQLIVYPTRPGLQTMGALVTMFCIWVIAFTLASPLYIFRSLKTHYLGLIGMDSLSFCIEDWHIKNGRAIYSGFSLIFQYLLPVLVVVLAHVQIHRRLRGRRRTTRKTPAILIAIAVTYVISWLPLNVFNLVADLSAEPFMEEKTMTITYAVCHMFGMSSAVSNPLLYGWLNDNFRKEFEEILCCCKKRQLTKNTRIKSRKMDTELTALAQLEHTVTANTKTSQCSQIF
ncbi:neuropeptide F receptor-like [Spodoptera litura]|uniref:Neuropeptide F receptor-like n=1 Tax=Spodoptera litura TaxID=69820 RepID=A0A9J7EGG4_SPOLT|nr:neuropeptide F receptor-like [Spodoptera litura]